MTQSETDASWLDVGAVEELKAAGATEVVHRHEIIAVFYIDDQAFALDGICAHQGGPLAKGQIAYDGDRPCVTCPWHGWQYELASGIQMINRQPLQRTFETRIRGGRVEVKVGKGSVE